MPASLVAGIELGNRRGDLMIHGSDDDKLARDMIDVHGKGAASVARENARGAAVAGQAVQAKSWIRVLGIIQQAGKATAVPSPGHVELEV